MWTRQNELHAAANSPYFAKDPEVVAQNKINSVPMKRLGTIDEVMNSVAFLFSAESSYTTVRPGRPAPRALLFSCSHRSLLTAAA